MPYYIKDPKGDHIFDNHPYTIQLCGAFGKHRGRPRRGDLGLSHGAQLFGYALWEVPKIRGPDSEPKKTGSLIWYIMYDTKCIVYGVHGLWGVPKIRGPDSGPKNSRGRLRNEPQCIETAIFSFRSVIIKLDTLNRVWYEPTGTCRSLHEEG